MSSHRDYEFTNSWYSKKTSPLERLLIVAVAVLLIPWVQMARDWETEKPKAPTRTSYQNRFLLTSQVLWRNSLVRIVRVRLPNTVLGYRRILASDEGLAFRPEGQSISVLAISRNAKPILEGNFISYIDPAHLPGDLVKTLELPFHSGVLKDYLLVPEVVTR